jgi:ribosomal protein L13
MSPAPKDQTVKTYLAKPGETQQAWHQFDADGAVLGRLASPPSSRASTTRGTRRTWTPATS